MPEKTERDYEALCIAYLEELIRINTVNAPGNEAACARRIRELMEQEGIPCHLQEIQPGRANLYSDVLPCANGDAPAILLSGHMDTVPAADGWDSDPFVLTDRGDRYTGRGTCDMKGGLACMMAAAVWAKDHQQKVPFRLAFVIDEEIWGLGTKEFCRTKILDPVRFAVIGEPTENRLHIAHRGCIRYNVTITGKSGHAGKPHLCADPVYGAAVAARAVEAVCRDLKVVKHEVLPAPTMCVTGIHAGIKDNVVPEVCTMTIDSRPGIGDTAEKFRSLILDKIRELGGMPEGMTLSIEPYIDVTAADVDKSSDCVRTCLRAYREVFGEEALMEAFPACCDQTYFKAAGVDSLLYGPGSIDQAHTANEFVKKSELRKCFRFYASLLRSDKELEI
ncbi:MAG: M20 family metallopeptidase [Lachnospiraceae bacterium]|nr:M20 family metallopeptidase [Lachnospiraceae bacterium]